MLEVNHLVKKFGQLVAVHDLSLQVNPGEIFGFLGPNGAGKTTTIKLIAGLLRPDAGTVTIHGFDVQKQPVEAKKALTYIPDEPYLYDKMTGRECLELIGILHTMPADDYQKRIDQLLRLFQVEEFADQLVESYSHGTRQKFVLASAFLPRPELILIDEPMVGLDPQNTYLVKQTLQTIAAEHRVAIFMSTHTLSLAQEICHRIGIIHQGRLAAYGTLSELQQQAKLSNSNLEELYLRLTGQYQHDKLDW